MSIEDILYDPNYMWVLIDTIYNTPTMVCRNAEEAVEAAIGGDRYTIKPVRIYKKGESE